MMLIEGYLDTHKRIAAQIDTITRLAKNGITSDNDTDIAREISKLAGMVTIHLSSEDKFLYPEMLKSSNDDVRKLARDYQSEMNGLAGEFNIFRDKYNTRSGLAENKTNFAQEWTLIKEKLTKRVGREENELYPKYKA